MSESHFQRVVGSNGDGGLQKHFGRLVRDRHPCVTLTYGTEIQRCAAALRQFSFTCWKSFCWPQWTLGMGIASQENLKTRGVWGHVLWKIFSTKDPNLCYTKVILPEVMITDIMKLCANAFLLHLLTTFTSTSTVTHSHLSEQLLSSNFSPWWN